MEELEHASLSVFQVDGEPAVYINGLPKVSPGRAASIQTRSGTDAESYDGPCFGGWLEGREVRKLFGDRHYSGKVTNFDSAMNWYRVVYEDGDFEDLEWHELEEVLVPLDISVPLKTLVLQIYNHDKSVSDLEGNAVKPRKRRGGNVNTVDKLVEQFPFKHHRKLSTNSSDCTLDSSGVFQEAKTESKADGTFRKCRDTDIDGTTQKDIVWQLGK